MAKKKKEETNIVYGVLSITFGVLGLIILAVVFGPLSIILGAIGVSKNKKDAASLIGLILGIIDIVFWLFMMMMTGWALS